VKKTVWLVLILAVALGWAAGDNVAPRMLSVNGEGSVEAEPDLAVVRLGVTVEDAGAATAYEKGNAAMQKVITAVEKLGVAKTDIRTVQLNLAPKIEYPETGTSKMKGYAMTHVVTIKVRDLNKVSNVIDGAASSGANKIDGIAFTFKDFDSLKSEARSQAFDNAKDRADDLADDAGVKLGKLTSISETSYDMSGADYGVDAFSAGVPAMTGSQTIKVTVFVTYEIQ
jgi:hypothetical protein